MDWVSVVEYKLFKTTMSNLGLLQDIALNVVNWGILWLNANIMVNYPRKIMSKGEIRKMLRKISSQWLIS